MIVKDKFGREIKRDQFIMWASSNHQCVGQVLSITPKGSVIILNYVEDRHKSGRRPPKVKCSRPWESIVTDTWPLSGDAFMYMRRHSL